MILTESYCYPFITINAIKDCSLTGQHKICKHVNKAHLGIYSMKLNKFKSIFKCQVLIFPTIMNSQNS